MIQIYIKKQYTRNKNEKKINIFSKMTKSEFFHLIYINKKDNYGRKS